MNHHTRRAFLQTGLLAAGAAATIKPKAIRAAQGRPAPSKVIQVAAVHSDFEREPLIRPFGFKGGYMTDIWQTVAKVDSGNNLSSIGLCTQNVLWSDARVFASHSEAGGNAIMYAITDHALNLISGQSFTSPVQLLEEILPQVYSYARKATARDDLRMTFVLNALVGVDNALWLLYAAENGITNFDGLIPIAYQPALSHHHDKVACIPLMAYNIPVTEINEAVAQGYFFMKIKIGQPGTQEEMLIKDMERLTAIHRAVGDARTSYTSNGRLPYYFDANGRYERKETLLRLLDHAKKIGAFEQIVLIEEPFDEKAEIEVGDLPVRIAADESAHTDRDAIERIEMGYGAIALKAIAKTLSMTMKIAQAAHERQVPCFCADLTVNPILVEWNKAVAARLSPFPGIGLGLLETNGHQNYAHWETMRSYHPDPKAPWATPRDGVFELDDDYYARSGGIFTPSTHYEAMFALQAQGSH